MSWNLRVKDVNRGGLAVSVAVLLYILVTWPGGVITG